MGFSMVDLFIIGAIVHFCALGLFLVRYVEENIDGQFDGTLMVGDGVSSDDDVVWRLRDECFRRLIPDGSVDVCLEAADEIERLREQNEYLKANVEMLLAEAKAVRGE